MKILYPGLPRPLHGLAKTNGRPYSSSSIKSITIGLPALHPKITNTIHKNNRQIKSTESAIKNRNKTMINMSSPHQNNNASPFVVASLRSKRGNPGYKIKSSGYILITTLLMIAGMTAIGTYIFLRQSVFVPFMRTMYQREQAKMVALSGIQMAIQQLSYFEEPESDQKPQQQPGGPQQLFARLMPIINRWQSFKMQKKIDGIDATMQVALVCEDGKINLNKIYNFEKGEFKGQGQPKGDWRKLMEVACKRIEEILGGKELLTALETFLKNRKYPLCDITELLTIKEFAIFRDHTFYQPTNKTTGDENQEKKAPVYLTDLFTTFSEKETMEPRLFSDSLLALLKLPQTSSTDQTKRAEQVKAMEKTFKANAQWPADWDTQLKPFYTKDAQILPAGAESALTTQFNPTHFSIFSYGTVGATTHRLLAVVQRNKRAGAGEKGYNITIRKLYWL